MRVFQASYNTSISQPALVKTSSNRSGSNLSVRPGDASGPSMRPGIPVVNRPTKTQAPDAKLDCKPTKRSRW